MKHILKSVTTTNKSHNKICLIVKNKKIICLIPITYIYGHIVKLKLGNRKALNQTV